MPYILCATRTLRRTNKKDGSVWAMLPRKETNDLEAFDLARQEDELKLFKYLVTRNGSTRPLGC
jgi:hypothetical protein